MIERRDLKQVDYASGRAATFIGATEDDSANADVQDRAGTHRAGFFSHVEIAVGESPIAHSCFRLSKGEHLGMRGGIFEQLDLIVGTRDYPAIAHNDGADGHFLSVICFVR